MILADVAIQECIENGKIKILPNFNLSDIRPTGIRLHLGCEILVPKNVKILVDINEPPAIDYHLVSIPEIGFILKPNMFVLGSTHERIMTPNNIVGHLEGRSTIARLGLLIHCTSGIIDNNHDEPRAITLELKNVGVYDLVIHPKIPIGMLVFSQLTHPIRQASQSQYRNQCSVAAPDLHFRTRQIEKSEER